MKQRFYKEELYPVWIPTTDTAACWELDVPESLMREWEEVDRRWEEIQGKFDELARKKLEGSNE